MVPMTPIPFRIETFWLTNLNVGSIRVMEILAKVDLVKSGFSDCRIKPIRINSAKKQIGDEKSQFPLHSVSSSGDK